MTCCGRAASHKRLKALRPAFWRGVSTQRPMAAQPPQALWLNLTFGKLGFCLGHEHCRATFQRFGDLEDNRQRGHVLAALNLAQVRAFDAREVRQHFLGNAAFRAQRTHRTAEGLGQFGIKGGGAGWPAALYGSLLHRQKRVSAAQLKPRYL